MREKTWKYLTHIVKNKKVIINVKDFFLISALINVLWF